MNAAAGIDADRRYRARLGMWVFLATELLFVGPLFVGYAHARLSAPDAFVQAARHSSLWLGSINTLLLLTSSFTMAAAVAARRHGALSATRRLLTLTIALGLAFLAIKGFEYAHDLSEGLLPGPDFRAPTGTEPGAAQRYFFLYFLCTGVHAVHLAIGLVLLAVLRSRIASDADAPLRGEITALYWHFIDVVWIFLFPAFYLVGRAS
ncbi:Quinol oxidase subunit 3 [Pigmentiphaga humi]|uniref:Quinol oxidase subunit 3 n=1 Tax=Pigmentiphaga humi TaxID=2478468 RepID=A0A3P4AZH3_9BURK|nr:cytochrome c oxidase subunit 3 [Pigmentiphaga humi]VCU68798.1 Quinol oxidase subunit 3 [Pigmentiphaga humi]